MSLSIGGAALTSNGTVVSMTSGGLVVGASTTMAMPAFGGTSTLVGLGGVIMSGSGPEALTGPEMFEGGAAARLSELGRRMVYGVICMLVEGR